MLLLSIFCDPPPPCTVFLACHDLLMTEQFLERGCLNSGGRTTEMYDTYFKIFVFCSIQVPYTLPQKEIIF